jgi:acyl-CoA thioesterase-1
MVFSKELSGEHTKGRLTKSGVRCNQLGRSVVGLLLLLSCLSLSFPPHSFAEPEMPRIVFLGDSLTAGYGIAAEEGYPAVLGRLLTERGYTVTIRNGGISGDTSAGGLRRLDWLLREKPTVFFLALGANDALRGLPTTELEKNLRAIIARVREQYPRSKVVLAGMEAPPNMGAEYAAEFREVYRRISSDDSLTFIPFLLEGVAGVAELNQADRLHPTPAGQAKIANTVLPYILPLLEGRAP